MKTNENGGPANIYGCPELRRIFGRAFRPGGLEISEKALELCSFPPGAEILDLACGAGATLELLNRKGFKAQGLELSPELAEEARKFAPVVVGDFHAPPWPDQWAHGIFCECALSLAEKPELVLSQSRRMLKDKGLLIISDLFGAGDWPLLIKRLAEAGFTPEHRLDYSSALKTLAARLVWELGSTAAAENLLGQKLKGEGRPGAYYLLISRKI